MLLEYYHYITITSPCQTSKCAKSKILAYKKQNIALAILCFLYFVHPFTTRTEGRRAHEYGRHVELA